MEWRRLRDGKADAADPMLRDYGLNGRVGHDDDDDDDHARESRFWMMRPLPRYLTPTRRADDDWDDDDGPSMEALRVHKDLFPYVPLLFHWQSNLMTQNEPQSGLDDPLIYVSSRFFYRG